MKVFRLAFLFLLISNSSLFAQVPVTDLDFAILRCEKAFESGTEEDIKTNFPLPEQQELLLSLDKSKTKIVRKAGPSKILESDKKSALVLLTGTLLFGNSGNETLYSGHYSGIYRFKYSGGKWTIAEKLPIDRKNLLMGHIINAAIDPGNSSLTVSDSMKILTQESYGFTVVLNHKAKITALQVDGKDADYVFNGGILWVRTKTNAEQQLALSYTLAVDKFEKDKNSGYFDDTYGHVRNQFFWHPFFSFSSPNDRANFSVRVTIPSAYQLATSLPQEETVSENQRIVKAQSAGPTFALGLYYDKKWKTYRYKKNDYQLEVFCDADFKPNPDILHKNFLEAYDLLAEKFGSPRGQYLAIVQDRSNASNGWLNRSNDMIVASKQGSDFLRDKPSPRAPFAHEVAHAWTTPIGPATNFLSEGWASYAERYFLEKQYGEAIFKDYLTSYKNIYFSEGFDTKVSLWDDVSNDGVSYYKGVWVFYMLEQLLGKEDFENGLKAFMQSGEPMTIPFFMDKLTKTTGKKVQPFLEPWLKSKQVPHVRAVLKDNALVVSQEGDVLPFLLEVEFTLGDGTKTLSSFPIKDKQHRFKLSGAKFAGAKAIKLDPSGKLLIKILE